MLDDQLSLFIRLNAPTKKPTTTYLVESVDGLRVANRERIKVVLCHSHYEASHAYHYALSLV